jgi:hypothetical protein
MTLLPHRADFSFQAFLSHRYKSPEVNLYFYNLFSETAEVQFEVDEGVNATNVTRLERMVRSADGFIGLYPFPGDVANPPPAELLRASRYFRLELDLAIRSGTPGIIYYDSRYGNIFRNSGQILTCPFKHKEVIGEGGYPSAQQHRESFKRFVAMVSRRMNFIAHCPPVERTRVVVLLPEGSGEYSKAHRTQVVRLLNEHASRTVTTLDWPPVLNGELFELFEEADWVVADIGDQTVATGLPSYLHGRFVPQMRLRRVQLNPATPTSFEASLLGGVDVGYRTDILYWRSTKELTDGFKARLESLTCEVRRINTQQQALSYFSAAAKRNEAVFLSYSGSDRDAAAQLDVALKARFHQVFNYRDGESLEAGKPWMSSMLDRLAKSAISVPLLTQDYFASGNCQQEAEFMISQRNEGKMIVIPIKLDEGFLNVPPYLQGLQYMRAWEYPSREAIVKRIEQLVTGEQFIGNLL